MEYRKPTNEEMAGDIMRPGLEYYYAAEKEWRPVPKKFLGQPFDPYVEYRMPKEATNEKS